MGASLESQLPFAPAMYPSEQAHLDFCAVDKCEVYRLADQAVGVSRLTC